jgi:hypothetical protein
MAFFVHPANKLKLLVPTHGNGIWVGERTIIPKISAAPDTNQADNGLPKRFALHQNYPNPFNPVTLIKYDVPTATHVKITIFDLLGRRVRTLVDEMHKAGYHAKSWDGKNNQGLPASTGLYFYQLHSSEFTKVRKMTLLR